MYSIEEAIDSNYFYALTVEMKNYKFLWRYLPKV